MTFLNSEPETQLAFSMAENKGVFALLLGSGLSRAAEIPTGWNITLDLVKRVGLLKGAADVSDWAKWYEETTGEAPNYSKLLEQVVVTPAERRSILHSYIEPTDADRERGARMPTKAHLAIAHLVKAGYIRVIITTNFDRLMENALREVGVEPTIVDNRDVLLGAEPLSHSQCFLLKLHGDYKDARILNTDDELSSYPEEYDRLLDRIFDEYGLIISGWSGEWDHALRAALLRAPNRRYPVYWSSVGSLGEGARSLVTSRGAKVVAVQDADRFFTKLRLDVETLAETSKANPRDTALVVANVKRFLGKAEYRIALDDLLSDQARQLLDKIGHRSFDVVGRWEDEDFVRRVGAYEDAVEQIARVAGVLGRWGEPGHLKYVTWLIKLVCDQAEQQGNGVSGYIILRSYPAVLILHAYCLGLVRANAWATLRNVLDSSIVIDRRAPVRLVESLYLQRWKGGTKEIWQRYPDLDRLKLPFSKRLIDLFESWSASFIGVQEDYLITSRRLEVLAALIYLDVYSEQALAERLEQRQQMIPMPVGHIAFDDNGEAIVAELLSEATLGEVLAAGYGHGSTGFVKLFEENFRRVCDRHQWEN